MKRIVSAMEENPTRENIVKVWKHCSTEGDIAVTEKAVEGIIPEQ